MSEYGHWHECMHCEDGVPHHRHRCHCGVTRKHSDVPWEELPVGQDRWTFPVEYVRTEDPRPLDPKE